VSAAPAGLRFDDGKDPAALRTIGEVAKALGLRQHVLRYWEQQFPMLQPLKRSGARRYYRPEDVALVQTIDRLVNQEGYTLKGARQAIAGGTAAPAEPASAAPAAPSLDILPHLKAIRGRLAEALAAA
jgi:DNA-binding transcriptional MerR regulator